MPGKCMQYRNRSFMDLLNIRLKLHHFENMIIDEHFLNHCYIVRQPGSSNSFLTLPFLTCKGSIVPSLRDDLVVAAVLHF